MNLDTQARTSYHQYRRTCDQLLDIANTRQKLESEIPISACLWGLHQPVWEEIQKRESDADINLEAGFEQSNLMRVLAVQFERANQNDLAKMIRSRTKLNEDLISDQLTQLYEDRETTPLEKFPEKFEKLRLPNTIKYRWALLMTNRICREKKWPESVKFILSLRDPIWKEDCLRLAAAIYAHAGQREQVLHLLDDTNLNPTEAVSVYRGLIVGLHAE